MYGGKILNSLVGLIVGIAGGLIGLGGAELRLPYLIGTLRLPPHDAVKVNLAVSLFTVAAAIPARLIALRQVNISEYPPFVVAITSGAVTAAYMGAAWLKRLSPLALSRIISGMLLALGIGLFAEAYDGDSVNGLLPDNVLSITLVTTPFCRMTTAWQPFCRFAINSVLPSGRRLRVH